MAVCVAVFKKEVPERPAHMPSFEIDEADRLWELMRNLWEFDPVNRPSSRIVRDTLHQSKLQRDALESSESSSLHTAPSTTSAYVVQESSSLSTEPVPQSMGRMSEAEQKLLTTERDHVRELEYMRDYWIIPLRDEKIIPEEHRSDFVRKVFCNLEDVIGVHTLLCDRLTKWQKAYPTGETIGDIFLDLVPHFAPLVQYGEHWPHGKYVFEKERESNPEFKKFVESVERLHMSRRLELNGYYLTKPMMRLAQYPMLLEMVLKNMSEGDADRATLLKAIGLIRELIAKLEQGTAGAENRLSLLRLKRMLVFKQGDEMDLELERQERQLIYKGSMKKRGGAADESGDLQLVLLDHVLLVVKSRVVDKREQLIAVQQPIPLELLVLSAPEENTTRMSKPRMMTFTWGNSGETTDASTTPTSTSSKPGLQKDGHQLALCRLGKRGCPLTLWASTVVARRKWVEHIMAQQKANRERNTVFDTSVLREDVLVDENKVNCVVPYDMGRRVAYGTDIGVFVQALGDGKSRTPAKVLDLPDVQQIDVLEECQLLVILSGRSVLIFPLDVLESPNSELVMKRMTRVSSYASFFKIGHCLGRAFLCIARANSSSSVIKLLELIDHTTWGKKIPTFKELLQNGNYTLKVFKEFYLPTECHSVHFLKTKLCVACKKGLETVDLKTLDTQVLDPADTSLDFMQRREDVCPLSIYPIDGEFLLCYTECAFYVGQTGRRSKRDVTIYWEGTPTAFALHYPYIIAFNPTFIEIRRVEDGSLAQVIRGNNLRCLFTDTQPFAANSLASNCPSYPYTNLNSTYLDSRKPAHALMLPRGRDDIMFVSDNKVMALRPAIPLPHALDELGTKV
ncbi:RHO1 GDP-GTP exchange protein 2 [Ceratobasidium sp. 395]|nr:RHO1 GDP-GTP exchange protein 2 [Ceratobasidium sp. 395]